jgi:hypothetical protein
MIPKIMIKSTGRARANSMSAWDRLLPDLIEWDISEAEKFIFCIRNPINE